MCFMFSYKTCYFPQSNHRSTSQVKRLQRETEPSRKEEGILPDCTNPAPTLHPTLLHQATEHQFGNQSSQAAAPTLKPRYLSPAPILHPESTGHLQHEASIQPINSYVAQLPVGTSPHRRLTTAASPHTLCINKSCKLNLLTKYFFHRSGICKS